MQNMVYGQILALGASLCGAYSSIAYNRIGQKVNSDILAFLRMIIAFPLMAVWALLSDGFAITSGDIHSAIILLIAGFVGFFITDMFLFRAYAVYGANQTMVVMCLAPLLSTGLSAVFFDETLQPVQYGAIVLTVIGVILMALSDRQKGGRFFCYGLVCALLAAGLQSCSDILTKSALSQMPHTTSAALRALGGLFGWSIFALCRFKGKIAGNQSLHKANFWFFFFVTVCIGTIVGTTLGVGSLKYAPAGIATSLKQISPVFILPYDFFILKKRSALSLVGTATAVAGVILFFL